jgi:hypothetical protein
VVAEVFAGISAFSSMFNIAKSLKDMNDVAVRNAAVSELWEQIFAAQSRYSEAIERIRDLEKELSKFETWEAEKQRYELKEVAPGAFAYLPKESMRGAEPPHWLCANCYQAGKKRLLQAHRGDASFIYHKCQECSGEIRVPKPPSPSRQAFADTGRRNPLGRWP